MGTLLSTLKLYCKYYPCMCTYMWMWVDTVCTTVDVDVRSFICTLLMLFAVSRTYLLIYININNYHFPY